MSYIGRIEQKASDIRRFNVTGSTSATHTLTWSPINEQSLIITINGIKQQEDAYSVSGNTLTLTSALVSTDKMEVIGILDVGEANTPADDSITNAMVKSDAAIAKSKLASLDIVDADVNASAEIALSKLSTTGTPSSSNYLRGDGAWSTISEYDDSGLQDDIAILGFKVASNGSLGKYNLVDQTVDDFQDASGIDTSTSTNEVRDSTSNYYSGVQPGNYFGDGSDGSLSTTGNVTHTVQNASGYDGDMVIKQYTDLTINSGHTMTVDDNCRGLFIYVDGDFVLNGTISMDGKGSDGNPANAGASDSAAVNASGLQLPLYTDSGTDTLSAATFSGTGTAVVNAVANQPGITGNGTIFSVARVGGSGGAVKTDTGGYAAGNDGTAGATSGTTGLALTGGGGSGAAHFGHSGAGAAGTCFSGGSGGGGTQGPFGGPYPTGSDGAEHGGEGGAGTSTGSASGPQGAGGGAGQPGGSAASGGTGTTNGSTGNGGVIWIVVKGNVSGSGTITADGTNGGQGANANGPNGGGSGAGGCIILCGGTDSSSFTNGMSGGTGGTPYTYPHQAGGAGGDGGLIQNSTIKAEGESLAMTLVSNSTTAEAVPTTGDIVMTYTNGSGTATVNTDLKAYVSRDDGTNWTQATLSSEGTTGGHTILTAHNVDISSQPSGTSMRYKIETLNQSASKETRIQAVSLGWA